jgi:hypothetical protein
MTLDTVAVQAAALCGLHLQVCHYRGRTSIKALTLASAPLQKKREGKSARLRFVLAGQCSLDTKNRKCSISQFAQEEEVGMQPGTIARVLSIAASAWFANLHPSSKVHRLKVSTLQSNETTSDVRLWRQRVPQWNALHYPSSSNFYSSFIQ